jgi:hypothetical protein
MKIKNNITNTDPLIVHAQGHVHYGEKWKKITKDIPLIKKETISPKITIVSFFALDERMVLKEQLVLSDIKHINSVDSNLRVWKNPMKIKAIAELSEIDTEYILCLDGIDILLSDDLSDILNRFETFNCDILYNASKINYPHVCKTIENSNTSFKFLNAGAFLGKTNSIIEFYRYLLENEMYKDYDKFNKSEQIRVRNGRDSYYKKETIKVDTSCLIFQTLNQSEFELDNNILKITK